MYVLSCIKTFFFCLNYEVQSYSCIDLFLCESRWFMCLMHKFTIFYCLICSDLIYDLLSVLRKRLAELDVSTILTILQCISFPLFF